MAMTTCRECSAAVSSEATNCPRCGIAEPGARSADQVERDRLDAARRAETDRRVKIGAGAAVALLLAIVLLSSFGGGDRSEDDDSSRDAVASMSALDQASIAFVGAPSTASVKAAMDTAFASTGTSSTNDSYSRAGSTLVSLRKRNGGTEMEILRCIPTKVGDPRLPDRTFPSVAALCSLTTTGALR